MSQKLLPVSSGIHQTFRHQTSDIRQEIHHTFLVTVDEPDDEPASYHFRHSEESAEYEESAPIRLVT